MSEADAVCQLPRPGLAGLDHRPGRLLRLLLPRRVLLPPQHPHERHQPRHRPDPRPPHDPLQRAQAVLRPHQAKRHICSVL